MSIKASKLFYLASFLGVIFILSVVLLGCGEDEAIIRSSINEQTTQTGDGLILEGEGPFPAILIARSENTLSNEENQLILQEISQELDKIMDLASQLEIIDDTKISE